MSYRVTNKLNNALLALGVTVAVINPAMSANITVDTFVDEVTSGNGVCSLREAIINANNNNDSSAGDCTAGAAGIDTISLSAGTYTLSIAGRNEDSAATGDLDITDIDTTGNSIVISGAIDANGAPTSIIDAVGIDRIFDIFSPTNKDNFTQAANFDGVTATLENLKLINGLASEGVNVDLDNQANGGAVYNWRFNNLTVANCVFDNNQAVWDGKFGIIDPDMTPDNGDEIEERTLSGHGGAIHSRGLVSITGSTFSNNTAYTTNDLDMNSIIEGENEKSGNGGGLFIAYTSTISDSTFINNTASNGGGINTTGGEPTPVPGNMTINTSTFTGNWAVMGGGVNNVSPRVTLDINNSTFSANTATDMGAGINSDADVNLLHVTVANNNVSNSDQNGAGINYFGPGGSYFISNTLLTNNSGKSEIINCGCTGGDTLACATLRLTSQGGNISSDFSCDLTSGLSDLQGPNPKILALADNGGPTKTHALDYDSLAIDNALLVNCAATDQRGETRPVDGNASGTAGCDIGSYERLSVNNDLVLNSLSISADTISVNDDLNISVSTENSGANTVSSARVDFVLPDELQFKSGSVTGGSACTIASAIVSCDLGDQTAFASANVNIVATAIDDATVSIKSVYSAIEVDTDITNNSATATLTINPAPVTNSSSGGGGFCSYNPDGKPDFVLPAILVLALSYIGIRRYKPINQK